LGILLADTGKYQDAEDFTRRAIITLQNERIDDVSCMATLYDNLGYIFAEKYVLLQQRVGVEMFSRQGTS
jgi:hypothetical protein